MRAKSSNRLAAWLAIQAGFTSLAGASILTDIIGQKWAGLALAISGSLQVATAAWVAATRPVESLPPALEP